MTLEYSPVAQEQGGVGDKPNWVRRQSVHFLMAEAESDVRASGADADWRNSLLKSRSGRKTWGSFVWEAENLEQDQETAAAATLSIVALQKKSCKEELERREKKAED